MNLITDFKFGDIVISKISPDRRMVIIRIQIYMNGSYQYMCSWAIEEGFAEGWFFEDELLNSE